MYVSPEPETLSTEAPAMVPVVVRSKSLASTPVTSSLNVTVKSTLETLVGLASARTTELTLGGVAS